MTPNSTGAETRPTYPDLAGKVALVTGGSGGIGSATCRLLAASGARVAVNARHQEAIDALVGAVWLAAWLLAGGPARGFFPIWPLLFWGFVLFRWGGRRLRPGGDP